MSSQRSVAANTAFLFGANIISKVFMALFMVLVARYLGVALFGIFSFSLTIVLILSSTSSLGMQSILVREIARNKDLTNYYLINALIIRMVSSVIFTLILLGLLPILGTTSQASVTVRILSFYILLIAISDICESKFRAHERMDYIVYFSITRSVLLCILGVVFLIYGYGLKGVALAYIGGAAASALLATLVALRKYPGGVRLRIDLTLCFTLLRQALPLSLAVIFAVIYFQIDIVMLGLMKNETVVGWYSASYRLIEALIFIPTAFTASLLPVMSRLNRARQEKLEDIAQKAIKYLIAISIPIVIIVVMLAGPFIYIIYGGAYCNSIPALCILVFAIPFIFVNNAFHAILISTDRQQIVGMNAALCVVVNIILNIALIPSLSYIGAAMATVITELALLISNVYFCSKQIKIVAVFRSIPLVLVISLIMAVFLAVSGGLTLPIQIFGAIVIYICVSLLLGSIRISELSLFFRKDLLIN